jgi:DNA-binding MarR family transcriptional regulator
MQENELFETFTQFKSLFPKLVGILLKNIEKELNTYKLNKSQMETLIFLRHSSFPTMGMIQQRLNLTKGAVTVIISNFEERGWVERLRDREDRRVIFVQLTQEGGLMAQKIKRLIANEFDRQITTLSEADLALLLSSLNNLNRIMSKLETNA